MTAGAAVYPFVVDLVARRVPPNGTVLELGCGGMQYEPLLPGRYLGLDLPDSPYIRRPPDVLGSAEALPLDDASVDVVFGVATFFQMDPVDAVFSECRRVLRPGGRLVVIDYQKHVILDLVERGDHLVRNVWDADELRGRLAAAGFRERGIRDLSHRAGSDGDVGLVRRPIGLLRYHVMPTRLQWLVMEARA